MLYVWIVLTIVAIGWLAAFGIVYLRARGARAVTCPDNHHPVKIEVDARRAAVSALLGGSALRVKDCSRWPEKAGCGEECLREIESSEDGCLVRSILNRWYGSKACVSCGREFGPIDWVARKPALLGPDGVTIEWNEVAPEEISEILATHRPICFDCHVAETFRRKYPDMVVDRPWDRPGTNTHP